MLLRLSDLALTSARRAVFGKNEAGAGDVMSKIRGSFANTRDRFRCRPSSARRRAGFDPDTAAPMCLHRAQAMRQALVEARYLPDDAENGLDPGGWSIGSQTGADVRADRVARIEVIGDLRRAPPKGPRAVTPVAVAGNRARVGRSTVTTLIAKLLALAFVIPTLTPGRSVGQTPRRSITAAIG